MQIKAKIFCSIIELAFSSSSVAFLNRYFLRMRKKRVLKTFTYLEFSNLTIIVIHSSLPEIIYATKNNQLSTAFPFLSFRIIVECGVLAAAHRKKQLETLLCRERNSIAQNRQALDIHTNVFLCMQLIADWIEIKSGRNRKYKHGN